LGFLITCLTYLGSPEKIFYFSLPALRWIWPACQSDKNPSQKDTSIKKTNIEEIAQPERFFSFNRETAFLFKKKHKRPLQPVWQLYKKEET